MKALLKAFATFTALLLGSYLVFDGAVSGLSNHDNAEAVAGIFLIAAGATAVWSHYRPSG